MAMLSLLPFKASCLHLPNIVKPTTKTLFSASANVHKHQDSALLKVILINDLSNFRTNYGNVKMKIRTMAATTENRDEPLVSDALMKRKWKFWDVFSVCWMISVHFLCLFAPFTFNWGAFWVAFSSYIICGLFGITLCYHRLLSHKSFKLPKWLEYVFAYCGVLAAQRDPIFWVSTHRLHHQFCDTEKDPHSPVKGFWFSHMTWIFDSYSIFEKCGKPNNVDDLVKQPFYKFLQSTYLIHIFASASLLYAIGGFPYLVWGMGVNVVFGYHVTWLVNSACHSWGKKAWNIDDLSRNNWWVALLTFGEGWHNNHHAFEYSARHGLEWWQVDTTWYLIRLLEIAGLATDVKLPTSAHKQKMALTN